MKETNLQKVIELLEGAGYRVTKAVEEKRAYRTDSGFEITGVIFLHITPVAPEGGEKE
jgi:tRNA G26 N,N-dimethylase Trm1